MAKVLIIATSKYTRGGITSVIKAHRAGNQWKKYQCKWIGYHIDKNNIIKVIFFLQAFIRYVFSVPFYDIVHFHISLPNDVMRSYLFFVIARLLNKKIVVQLHCGDQISTVWNKLYYKIFTKCDVALVLYPSLLQQIRHLIGDNTNIQVLYNPCNPIKDITPVSYRRKIILFAGTLCSNKGYKDLILAFSRVARKFSNWELLFAGNGEIEQAKQLATQCGIIQQCKFVGWISGPQKDELFRKASVLCLPSYEEGFPMAVLDAWSYGIPVVSSYAGGLKDIVKDGQNGLLFCAGDISALSRQLSLIMSDDACRKRISENVKIIAETIFDRDFINSKLENIYDSLIVKK